MPDILYDDLLVEEVATPGATPTAKRATRRTLLIASAALALLILGAAAVMLWTRGEDAGPSPAAATASDAYVDAPPMVVNLRGADGRPHFLKLRFVIVAADASDKPRITAQMPAIVDGLQSFLRALRPEDLNGSAAVFRVKEEMMIRTQAVLGTGKVRDILIQDLVEQ